MEILQPPGWVKPKGFSHGIAAQGRMIFVAGQIGCDGDGKLQSLDFVEQLGQALHNTVAVLKEGGAGPEHIARMTWYVIDKKDYTDNLQGIGQVYRRELGRVFPAMALFEVAGLVDEGARIEVETTAVVPDVE
jgi:enamine deaminase RidA (YjgF/YER057c/UK114 family)